MVGCSWKESLMDWVPRACAPQGFAWFVTNRSRRNEQCIRRFPTFTPHEIADNVPLVTRDVPRPQVTRTQQQGGPAMYIWRGPDSGCFYNEAYRQSIGTATGTRIKV